MAQEEEISALTRMGTSTPEQAAENIQGAEEFGVTPEAFKASKGTYTVALNDSKQPAATDPAVARTMSKSTEHAAVVKEDLSVFNDFGKYMKLATDLYKGSDVGRDMNNFFFDVSMGRKSLKPESNKLEDQQTIFDLDTMMEDAEALKGIEDYEFAEPAEFLLEAGVAGVDVFKGLLESKKLIGSGTIGGFIFGAIMAGVPGALLSGGTLTVPLALAGGRLGALKFGGLATTAAFIKDTFSQTTGAVYKELYFNADPDLPPMPEDERKAIAIGAGGLSSILTLALPIAKISKNIPWIRAILRPKLAVKYLQSAAGAPIKGAARIIVESGLAEALEEGSQEAIQIVAEEIGKTWDGSETSFVDALGNSAKAYERTIPRIGKTAALGGTLGSAFAGGALAIDPVMRKAMGDRRKSPTSFDTEVAMDPEGRMSQFVPENQALPPVITGLRAVQIKQMIDKTFQIFNKSKTEEVTPNETDIIIQEMYDRHGIGDLFMDKDDLNEWADTEEKANDIREAIGADILDGEVNAPVIISASKLVRLMKEYPELSGMVKDQPEHGTAGQHLARLERDDRRREEVKKKLGEEATVEDSTDIETVSDKRTRNIVNEETRLVEFEIDEAVSQQETLQNDLRDLQVKPSKTQDDVSLIAEYEGLIASADENISKLDNKLEELNKEESQRARDEDIFDEDSYFEQETFTPEMNEVLPKAEILKVNSAQLTARTEVATAIRNDIDKKMTRVIDIDTEMTIIHEREVKADHIESDEDVQLVEDYLNNNKVEGELNAHQKSRVDKGQPAYSINPETLNNNLRNQKLDDEVLKKRKVFHKDGIPINDAVVIFGAQNPTHLLRVLSETPTRKQSIENHVAEVREEIRQENIVDKEYVESETSKAYDNMTKVHIKEMKILLKSAWPALKKGIKRVAVQLPTLPQLKAKAKNRIGRTKLKHLKPNRWEVGERKSQRKAVNAILKNEVEVAFREKENAAYNTQLSRETRIAIGKVNNVLRWVTRFNDNKITNVLKEAGPTYLAARDNILDLFGDGRKQVKIDDYNKWVTALVKEGKGDFVIPNEVLSWLTTTESLSELTVDQTVTLGDILKNIHHQAKLKNALHRKYTQFHETQATEIIGEEIKNQLVTHPAYDTQKANELAPVSAGLKARKAARFLNVFAGSLQNIKAATLQLDRGKEGGFFFNLIFLPIDRANLEVVEMSKGVRDSIDAGIAMYGEKDYQAMGRTTVTVPEFKDSPGLNRGKLLKVDLFRLLMNMGNDGNIETAENYNVSRETMMKVLERELGQRDFDFVQDHIWGMLEKLAPRLQEVHLESTGTELDMVSFTPFEAHGKQYKGGYFPIKLAFGTTRNNGFQLLQGVYENSQGDTKSQPFSAYEGFVRSPHTKSRQGSKWILDLDAAMMGSIFDDLMHDIAFRIPIRDIQQIMNDPVASFNIKSTIGTGKYNALLSNVARLTHNFGTQDLVIHKEIGDFLVKTLRHLENGTIVNWLMLSPSTVAINFLALREIGAKMGPRGALMMNKTALRITSMLMTGRRQELIDHVTSIDPSALAFIEGIDDFTSNVLHGKMPKVRLMNNRPYHIAANMHEALVDFSLNKVLGTQDFVFKSIAVITAKELFMSGHAPGHKFDVSPFSEAETEARANAYAHSVVAGTTMRAKESDKAALQFDARFIFATRLWNELRSVFNNRIQATANIGYDGKAMNQHIANGEFAEANIALGRGADGVATLVMLAFIGMSASNMIQGKEPFPLEEDGEEPLDFSIAQFKKAPQWAYEQITSVGGLYNIGAELYGSPTPMVRDALFGLETGRGSSLPVLTMADNMFNAPAIGYEYIKTLVDDATFIEAFQELGEKKQKKLAGAIGALVGGLPVSAYFKWMKIFGLDEKEIDELALPGIGSVLSVESTKSFLDKAMSTLEEVLPNLEKKPENKEIVETIKKTIKQNAKPMKVSEVPNSIFEIIKFTESRGRWFATNPKSKARGFYQFMNSKGTPTWQRIVNSKEGGDAGLTLNGIFKKDTWQQEKAMRIFTQWNMNKLHRAGIDITLESIYYMHHFDDIAEAKKIFLLPPNKSMAGSRTLRSKNVEQNPWLNGVKTAGDIRKGLRGLLRRGEKLWQNTL